MALSDDLAKQRVRGFQNLHGVSQPPRYRETGRTTSEDVGVGRVTRKNVVQNSQGAEAEEEKASEVDPSRWLAVLWLGPFSEVQSSTRSRRKLFPRAKKNTTLDSRCAAMSAKPLTCPQFVLL